MRSTPGTSPQDSKPVKPDAASRERALIMAALNQVDRASTWTSGPPNGSAVSPEVSPDAPTAADRSEASQPRTAPLPGRDAFPGYDIQREIHRGGQGVVYLATQRTTRRRVALKVMHGGATLGTTGRARFDREVQLLGQLNHPNIVKIHDSGATGDGSLFYVMDYVSGRALDEVLREQRREMRQDGTNTRTRSRGRSRVEGLEDIENTLEFFVKICDGVNAAHLRGVIHRDIKPANVRVDQNGEPVLVDFGLAKVAAGVDSDLDPGNPMTMTGQFIGSLPWASPEQAVGSGDAIDLRSDVYSLGVMLYQMLTGGRFPYQVIGNMRDVLDNIQRVEPARPSTIRRQINDEVETIVLKSLAKEKDRRYQSAGELGRDIRRYLAGEPIEAKRDAGWYVIRKTLNRHKAAASFAVGAGLIITGSAVGMTGMWRQAEGARAVAVAQRDRAEDNLDAVRDMANTFLYDFHDSIANLRGATRAREIILEKAIAYLGMLAALPDPDDGLLADLADAHDRVGDLEGELNAANIGDTAKAMQHYQEAMRIRTGLLERHPDDAELRRLLAGSWKSIGEAHRKDRRFPESMEALTRASEIASAARATNDHLEVLTLIGDVHLVASEDLMTDAARFDAELAEAERVYRLADAGWAQVNAPESARRRAQVASRLSQCAVLRGRTLLMQRDEPDAANAEISRGRKLAEDAARTLAALSAADPTDHTLARDFWVVSHHLAESVFDTAAMFQKLGRPEVAAKEFASSLDMFRECQEIALGMAADPSNLEAVRDLAVTMNKVGNCLSEIGQVEEARAVYADNLELRRELVRSDPVLRHLRDLGVGVYKLALTDESRAAAAATEPERRALLELAAAEYREAIETFQTYTERGGSGQAFVDAIGKRLEGVREAQQGG